MASTASTSTSTAPRLSVDDRLELITRNLAEVLGKDAIRSVLEETAKEGSTRVCRLYWGTATTGRPHIGYFVPLVKLADFLQAGVHVIVLLADLHAFLDNLKAPIELIAQRVEYYARVIRAALGAIGVPVDRLEFITGTSYQYRPDYNFDKYKLCAITSEHDARKAGSEVVKESKNAPLSGLIYPLLQALDEQYLDVDIQFGGLDQRKIFTFAEENLPKLGYRKRAHLMNALVPGLTGEKMSSSEENSKLDFLDRPEVVTRKIKAAFAEEGKVEGNGLLAFARAVLFPVSTLRLATTGSSPFVPAEAPKGTLFVITRPEKFGGTLHFTQYDELESAYADKSLHPGDLKKGVTEAINALLAPILAEFDADESFRDAERRAYPPPEAPAKKAKVKKVNPRFAKPDGDAAPATGAAMQTSDGVVPDPPTLGVSGISLAEAPAALKAVAASEPASSS